MSKCMRSGTFMKSQDSCRRALQLPRRMNHNNDARQMFCNGLQQDCANAVMGTPDRTEASNLIVRNLQCFGLSEKPVSCKLQKDAILADLQAMDIAAFKSLLHLLQVYTAIKRCQDKNLSSAPWIHEEAILLFDFNKHAICDLPKLIGAFLQKIGEAIYQQIAVHAQDFQTKLDRLLPLLEGASSDAGCQQGRPMKDIGCRRNVNDIYQALVTLKLKLGKRRQVVAEQCITCNVEPVPYFLSLLSHMAEIQLASYQLQNFYMSAKKIEIASVHSALCEGLGNSEVAPVLKANAGIIGLVWVETKKPVCIGNKRTKKNSQSKNLEKEKLPVLGELESQLGMTGDSCG